MKKSGQDERKRGRRKAKTKGGNLLPFSVQFHSPFRFFLCDWLIVVQIMTKVERKASERETERK